MAGDKDEGIALLAVDRKHEDYGVVGGERDRPPVSLGRRRLQPAFGTSAYNTASLYLEPRDALAPLIAGGLDSTIRPPPTVKSVPAYAPYGRWKRNRTPMLQNANDFRHWWKWSRLLTRLGGLYSFAVDPENAAKFATLEILKRKGPGRALKLVKRLGQGGEARHFLKTVQPFTRGVRIVVAAWRWAEAAECRRSEVGAEEAMAFVGNRVSRYLAKELVDWLAGALVIPLVVSLLQQRVLTDWHPEAVLVLLGILRALAPFFASFVGSFVGRFLVRRFVATSGDRWRPVMRINELSLTSTDCCEYDEASSLYQNGDMVALAKEVARAIGRATDGSTVAPQASPSIESATSNRSTADCLKPLHFELVGAGSGGYSVYSYHQHGHNMQHAAPLCALLHVTPYGPAIMDELPRYIVLERAESVDSRTAWSPFLSHLLFRSPPVVEGYCYKGAFFTPHQFAAMRDKYTKVLEDYGRACNVLCSDKPSALAPPTDLVALKKFLETARKKDAARLYAQVQGHVDQIAQSLISRMPPPGQENSPGQCHAPAGVILYFEGLDCAGKSSTGGLVQQALERAGYDMKLCQYNKPPTAEQRQQPWMNRFEKPQTKLSGADSCGSVAGAAVIAAEEGRTNSYQAQNIELTPPDNTSDEGSDGGKPNKKCYEHHHAGVVWDRGPAGDFVYGTHAKLPTAEKLKRYAEFQDFDAQCAADGVLLCKLLFVADRDTIAKTIGKRLAQKKIAQDLRTWLNASAGHGSARDGLDEIDRHIDPTDFLAFNAYQDNLHKFANFARHTDKVTDHGSSGGAGWSNPWLVICTTDRHAARLELLQWFRRRLNAFATVMLHAHLRLWDALSTIFQRTLFCTSSERAFATAAAESAHMACVKRARLLLLLLGICGLCAIYYVKTFDDGD